MNELDRTIIKEKIEEVLKKTEEYGKQAEQYNLTNKELSELIKEQIKLKDMFNEVVNAYQKFIEYVDSTYNEKVLKDVEGTLNSIKIESEKIYSKLEDYKLYLDNKLLLLCQNYENLKEELGNKYTLLSNLMLEIKNDLNEKISNLLSFNKQVKEDLNIALSNCKEEFVNIANENNKKTSEELLAIKKDVNKLIEYTNELKIKTEKSSKRNLGLFISLIGLEIIGLIILFVLL